jgi:hypothetical protein
VIKLFDKLIFVMCLNWFSTFVNGDNDSRFLDFKFFYYAEIQISICYTTFI